jgi:hypothetical protein
MITCLTTACHRPEAWALSEFYMSRQTVKPDQWLVLDNDTPQTVCTMGQEYHYWPELSGESSMTKKIHRALQLGLIKGDIIIIWENDDYYAPTWIEWCVDKLKHADLVGEGRNLYYNVRNRWWFDHGNTSHASLCATAMTSRVLPQLLQECNRSSNPWLDDRLWKNCRLPKKVYDPHVSGKRLSIGIKAMPGLKGYGSGHDKDSGWAIRDPELKKLRSLIGEDAEAYAKFHEPSAPEPMPSIEVHIVTFNEELILPYALRHYKTFASRIIIHDGGSTDRTLAIAKEAGVEIHNWDTGGKINDEMLRVLKETCWLGTNAAWVVMVDADEFVHFPHGVANTLAAHSKLAIIKCKGFEMESPTLPVGDGQIYDEIDHGAPDDRWYGKPCLLRPSLLRSVHFTHGAHEANGELRDRSRFIPRVSPEPVVQLLHYHHIGSVERIGDRYDGNKSRFSELNKKHGWGWQGDGRAHAQQKRDKILAQRGKVV